MKILIAIIKVILIASVYINIAHAGLYKCINEQGELSFSDVPCDVSSQETVLEKDYDERGFRMEFFKNPGNSPSVMCTGSECRCGAYHQVISNNAVKQLTASINHLTTAWGNVKYGSRNKRNTTRNNCEIKVHQKLINRFYPITLQQQVTMYRMEQFMNGETKSVCGSEPSRNSQSGWTSDRKYIDWYQCQQKHNGKQISKSNRKQKRAFKRLERALSQMQ
jgi:hypothetical protein